MSAETREFRIDDESLWFKENFLFERLFGFKILPEEEKARRIVKENDFRIIQESGDGLFSYSFKPLQPLSIPETIFLFRLLELIQSNDSLHPAGVNTLEYLESLALSHNLFFEEPQKQNLANYINALTSNQGILSFLLNDSELEEISVIGLNKKIRVYHQVFGWISVNAFFTDSGKIIELINSLVLHENKSVSFSKPVLNSVLSNGSRINAVINPAASEAAFTIRKFNFHRMTPLSLIKSRAFDSSLLAFLSLAIQSNSSIVIAGNTGSGKTTALNALLSFLGREERMIIVEETPELLIPQNHFIKLKSVEELDIKFNELVTESLRARPDALILGEIRNSSDIKAFANALLSGQAKSCITTMHAFTAFDAVQRLEHLGAKESELKAIDLILILKRISRIKKGKGKKFEERRVTELAEILPGKKEAIQLNTLFSFDFRKNSFKKINESVRVKEKIMQVFSFSGPAIQKELKKRTLFFEENKHRNMSLNEFISLIKKENFAW